MEIKQLDNVTPIVVPQLVIGIIPCLTHDIIDKAWPVIHHGVDELVIASGGEYGHMDVRTSVYYGQSNLYMGYMVNKPAGFVNKENMQSLVVEKLFNSPLEDFVGFFIIRIDAQTSNLHIWQAYIAERFRGTNAFHGGYEFMKGESTKWQAKSMTFSSPNSQWDGMAESIGFKKTTSVYRINIA